MDVEALYPSLVRTDDELRRDGRGVPEKKTPKRTEAKNHWKYNAGKRREPTWIFLDVSPIDSTTIQKMLVEAMRTVLKVLMETHTYEFANNIRRQRRGGAIGMELTGVVAQIFMNPGRNCRTWTCT